MAEPELADNVGGGVPPPPTLLHCVLISPVPKLHKEWMNATEKQQTSILEEIDSQLLFDFLGEQIECLPNGFFLTWDIPRELETVHVPVI
eukprot:6910320-Ditylum_brightwellii.AAC.1